jgi:hypothetical protein
MNSPKPVDVISEAWDYLIVLDACRYDYFERYWKDYLPEGQLSCRWSCGSCTDEWKVKSFPDCYDNIIYLSANPQIGNISVYGYCARDHFSEVVEIWKNGWDSEIGTVLPETVTNKAIQCISKVNTKGKRFIVHYMQPHAPYIKLALDPQKYRFAESKGFMKFSDMALKTYRPRSKVYLYRFLSKLLKNTTVFGNHPDWKLRKYLNLPPLAPMEYVLQKCSVQQLREAYRDNLQKAMFEIARLLKYLSGKIIVTSDHGELLGENKCFSHPCRSDHPILRGGPWLEIKKETAEYHHNEKMAEFDSAESSRSDISEDEIVQRLRDLGYHD